MKFSIITCTKNSERYIRENILSVETQTFTDYEHIFIDGHSTDRTKEIINEYMRRYSGRVKLFEYEPKGIANAMNMGIKHATGDYITFLHSDDRFFDATVLNDVNDFLDRKELDWIYGKEVRMYESGEIQALTTDSKYLQYSSSDLLGKYLLKYFLFIKHQSVFTNESVFKRYGCFNEGLQCAMDYDFFLRIISQTKWSFFNRIIDKFTVHENNRSLASRYGTVNAIETLLLRERHMNKIEKKIAFVFEIMLALRNDVRHLTKIRKLTKTQKMHNFVKQQ
ncbi:MAG: glycosyltransferase [Patescibacteria group bacterium]|nr:glycosyltransferase [Patescibacteria group bacterium]